MQRKTQCSLPPVGLLFVSLSLACAVLQPTPFLVTNTPEPTATITLTPTGTPIPSPTLRPTQTPNLAGTQRAQELDAEVRSYFGKGYLTTTSGRFRELDDFSYEWAQLGWYNWLQLRDSASDFLLSGHFKWNSAYPNSDTSGCGFIFAAQPNDDHYAVFLDRSQVYFLITDQMLGYSKPISPTRGTGRVRFAYPAEANFTLIIKGAYAYVLVNGEVVGEYTLSQSRPLHGNLGLTVLSGTNKDYGTRCEMTSLRLWIPEE